MNESIISRAGNLLGALSLGLADAQREATTAGARESAGAPAALVALTKYPGETVAFFQPILGLTQSGTVRLVDRLVESGLVRRRPGRDRRSVALELTASGRRAAARVERARATVLEDALSPVSVGELAELERMLELIVRRLASTRDDARRLCRLCDEGACSAESACPVDAAVTAAGYLPYGDG